MDERLRQAPPHDRPRRHRRRLLSLPGRRVRHRARTHPARPQPLPPRHPPGHQAAQMTPIAGRSNGHRYYDWAWISIEPGRTGHHWLLIRRNRRTRDLAFYHCYSPRHVPLATLVTVAGRRWAVEENIQASKGLAGLDEHQVRTWTSWHRWVTLAMLACAFLTVAAAAEHTRQPPPGQIPLTCNEIARLFTALIISPAKDTGHLLHWSAWRRRHQHHARRCHYLRQDRERRT